MPVIVDLGMVTKSGLENPILEQREFYEMKFFYYISAQSTHNVIPILWIKLEDDLILLLPRPLQYIVTVLLFCLISYISFVWKL